jgi:hypothetical protein
MWFSFKDVSCSISLLLAVSFVYIGKQLSKAGLCCKVQWCGVYCSTHHGLERAETCVGVKD